MMPLTPDEYLAEAMAVAEALRLIDKLEADRDSWRRTAERLEAELRQHRADPSSGKGEAPPEYKRIIELMNDLRKRAPFVHHDESSPHPHHRTLVLRSDDIERLLDGLLDAAILAERGYRATIAHPTPKATAPVEAAASRIAAEVFGFAPVRERLTEAETEAFHGFVQGIVIAALGAKP